jgi:phosphatidylglycerol:prolipoprotein diacylglycerol transferase
VARGLITPLASCSLPIHPTQLYAALAGFGLVVSLLAYHNRRRFDGEVMTIFMVGYAATRFWVENLRAEAPVFIFGLTFSQAVSLVDLVSWMASWLWLNNARPGPVAARLAYNGSDE